MFLSQNFAYVSETELTLPDCTFPTELLSQNCFKIPSSWRLPLFNRLLRSIRSFRLPLTSDSGMDKISLTSSSLSRMLVEVGDDDEGELALYPDDSCVWWQDLLKDKGQNQSGHAQPNEFPITRAYTIKPLIESFTLWCSKQERLSRQDTLTLFNCEVTLWRLYKLS